MYKIYLFLQFQIAPSETEGIIEDSIDREYPPGMFFIP